MTGERSDRGERERLAALAGTDVEDLDAREERRPVAAGYAADGVCTGRCPVTDDDAPETFREEAVAAVEEYLARRDPLDRQAFDDLRARFAREPGEPAVRDDSDGARCVHLREVGAEVLGAWVAEAGVALVDLDDDVRFADLHGVPVDEDDDALVPLVVAADGLFSEVAEAFHAHYHALPRVRDRLDGAGRVLTDGGPDDPDLDDDGEPDDAADLSPETWARVLDVADGDPALAIDVEEVLVDRDMIPVADGAAAAATVDAARDAGVLVDADSGGAYGGLRLADEFADSGEEDPGPGDETPTPRDGETPKDDPESAGKTPEEPRPALVETWAEVDRWDRPEPDVYAPATRARRMWLVRRPGDKFGWAPWGDRDHPEAEAGKDARRKWSIADNWGTFDRAEQYVDMTVGDEKRTLAQVIDGGDEPYREDGDPFLFVDGDDVRDPETGAVHPAFVDLLDRIAPVSYTAVSTSGGGVHVLLRGELPDGAGHGPKLTLDDEPFAGHDDPPEVELYDRSRTRAVTGEHVPGTGTAVAPVDDDDLREVLDEEVGLDDTGVDPEDVDPVGFDADDHEATATSRDETTTDARDVFAALDRLDARRVAADTIVHSWNDEATTSGGKRAFRPTWGPNSNGTANVVDAEIWQDTGGNGYGGPAVMAAIDAGLVDERAGPRDVDGETWVKAVEHLRDLGYDLPKYVGEDEPTVEEYRPDPRDVDVVLDPERAWDAAGRVTPADLDGEADLAATDDARAFRCPCCAESVDVVRAVAVESGLVETCDRALTDTYPEAYRRAREDYGAPLPVYLTTSDAIAEYGYLYAAAAELTFWHLDAGALRCEVTGEGVEVAGEAVRTLDPTPVDGWRDSDSGESVLVFPSGTVWDADTETTIDALRFVGLDAGLLDSPDEAVRADSETFREVYRLAREEYGAPLPRWRGGTGGEATAMLPPAEELVGDVDDLTVERDRLDEARADVEDLYRRVVGAEDDEDGARERPAVLRALPALGKTTSAVKTARDRPTTYLAPRKELQADALDKAERRDVSARALPIFADARVDETTLSAAVGHVREYGKDRLRDRWAIRDAVDGAVFDEEEEESGDEDDDEVELDRPTCTTADGEHGEAWALAVHIARELGYTPRDIHTRARALFGAPLPCAEEHAGGCPYSQGWDRVSDPDAPVDLLVGHYVHAHVESARTYYTRGQDGTVDREARAVVLDEYPGIDAYGESFGEAALDHATWLARALRPDVEDRRDLLQADLAGDDYLTAWLDGEGDRVDAVDDAVGALGRRADLLDAVLDTAARLREDYDDALDALGVRDVVGDLVDGDVDDYRQVAADLDRSVAGVRPEDDLFPVARWIGEDLVAPLDRAAAGDLAIDVDALPGGGELHALVNRALDAAESREESAAAVCRAARDALLGGGSGARELAVWADDGYAHPDAHHLLAAVVAGDQDTDRDDGGDGGSGDTDDAAPRTVTRIATSQFAFDPEATDGTRLDRVAVGDRVTVLLDRNGHGATVHKPPERTSGGGDDAPLVGLDATARAPLWAVALGEDVDVEGIHDTPRERAEFLRDVMSLRVIQAADKPRSYEGDPDGKDLGGDVALVEALAEEYGGVRAARQRGEDAVEVGPPAVITTKDVRERLENDERLDDAVAAWDNYGNVTGTNDLGSHRLAAILGSQHYGDRAVEHLAALAGEEVERTGYGEALDYGGDVANAYLRHMREDQTMQAILRFARGDTGATVVARTSALREDLPVVGEGQVAHTYSDTATKIARAWRRLGDNFTAADVREAADGLDVDRRQVRRVLAEFVEAGYLDRVEHGPGRAHTYTPADDPGAGEVTLPGVEPGVGATAPGRSPSSVTYTWNVRVARGGLLRDRARDGPPGDGTVWPGPENPPDEVVKAVGPPG